MSARAYRMRIRNEADSADELVISSRASDQYPYITGEPSGDGQSTDPITGAATASDYSIRVADVEIDPDTETRVVTSQLANSIARWQHLSRRAYIEQSSDGTTWTNMVPGYVLAERLISAIEWEFQVGETRRRETNKTIFKTASALFPGVTCIIGGPVIGGFAEVLADGGGWTFEVNQIASSPDYVQLKLVTGFDPRKDVTDTFSTISQAIIDYTNDWARPFFEPIPDYLGASTAIQGHFPGITVKVRPAADSDDTNAEFYVPLAEPEATPGPWFNPNPLGDNLTRIGDGHNSLWIPTEGVDINGDPVTFSGSVSDEYSVWVYASAISEDNPLHIYEHPVDLWEKVMQEIGYVAGLDYDDTVLPDLKEVVGPSFKVALRITEPYKPVDFIRDVIYGPFRTSSRVDDGKVVLFSIELVNNSTPSTTITIDDLRSDSGTVFELDRESVITSLTLKTKRFRKWSSEDKDQPAVDGLVVSDGYPDSIENSDDDIPPGMEREVQIGDIPGMILSISGDAGYQPISMEKRLVYLGNEFFPRFGRGAASAELHCLPNVTAKVGEEINVNLVHRPVATAGGTPVTKRSGVKPVQIVARTETAEGPDLRVVDSLSVGLSIVDPEFTLSVQAVEGDLYAHVIITNADDLNAGALNARADYAISTTEPTGAGTHWTTILWPFMTNPVFDFDVGPFDEGSTVWVRMRSEPEGGRAGEWTAWKGVTLGPVSADALLTAADEPLSVASGLYLQVAS